MNLSKHLNTYLYKGCKTVSSRYRHLVGQHGTMKISATACNEHLRDKACNHSQSVVVYKADLVLWCRMHKVQKPCFYKRIESEETRSSCAYWQPACIYKLDDSYLPICPRVTAVTQSWTTAVWRQVASHQANYAMQLHL